MSKNCRNKNYKPLTQQINCFNCNHCTYIGEGDYVCEMSFAFVIRDWTPNDDFYHCKGKDFENL